MENSNEFIETLILAGMVVASLLIFVRFIFILNRLGKRREKRKQVERAEKMVEGITARARIVELRRAGSQRSRDFTIFRVLLEIHPADLEPFSTVVVWEVEPSALTAMQPEVVIPVRFHQSNLREIHPELAGARYSDHYQHAHLGIENDIQVENIATAANLAPPAPKENTIYRRRSKTRIFGLPLWEVAFNLIRKKGNLQYAPRNAKARAVFAVGDHATGIVAIGSFAKGIVAFGHFAVGLVAFGAGAFGVFGIGLMSFGVLAFGLLSGGFLTFGAITAGFASVGFLTISRYGLSKNLQSTELLPFYNLLKNLSGLDEFALRALVEYVTVAFIVAAFAFFILWFIVNALLVKYLEPNDNRLDSPHR